MCSVKDNDDCIVIKLNRYVNTDYNCDAETEI